MSQDRPLINTPPNNSAVILNSKPSPPFSEWFTQVFRLCFTIQQHGTTAERPSAPGTLFTGRGYFDTTLGYKIWWNGNMWVKYDGTAA